MMTPQKQQRDGDVARFDFIPLKQLRESPTNPRKDFGDLAGLRDSIAAQGVLQPVLVRPWPGKEGEFEIVCGARRTRAAREAKIDFMPAVTRSMSDAEVVEAQVTENSQRLDPHPMDEAEAFNRLVNDHGIDVAEVAAKVGRPASFVYQRLRLLDLVPEARKAFKETFGGTLVGAGVPSPGGPPPPRSPSPNGSGDGLPQGRGGGRDVCPRVMIALRRC